MKTKNRLIPLVFLFTAVFLIRGTIFPRAESSSDIWIGFMSQESGTEGGRSAASDHNHAYGIFQFDDRYDLIPFLGHCLAEDPVAYGDFERIYSKYAGTASGKSTVSESAEDTQYLTAAWHKAYDADPEGFTKLQMDYFVADYYPACSSAAAAKGIDLDSDQFSPIIRGTLMSISIWAGQGAARRVVNRMTASMTELEMLDVCYSQYTADLKDPSKYERAFDNRWKVEQKALALQDYAKWSLDPENEDVLTTSSDLTNLGTFNVHDMIDGSYYRDYVADWIGSNEPLTKSFRAGGWNHANREWALSLMQLDFFTNYKIIGTVPDIISSTGGVLSNFGDYAAGGGYTGLGIDIDVSSLSIPNEQLLAADPEKYKYAIPVVYYQQDGQQPWSGVAFGDKGNNIAKAGCSVTSLAMVITYLKSGTDISSAEDAITPDEIVQMIAAHNGGNGNAFHVPKIGQSHEIISAVAGYYGVNCRSLGGNATSIVSALQAGHPIIVSASGPQSKGNGWRYGTFTQRGHYLVLTGLTADGQVLVNNPSNPAQSGQSFSVAHIIHETKGWWELY